MIAYFDTSALIPLLISEPSTSACQEIWNAADEIVTSQLAYVESAAALTQAKRLRRLTPQAYGSARTGLDTLWLQLHVVAVDHPLMVQAAAFADRFGLRGYDAVHCASAQALNDKEFVAAAGDLQLLASWRELGLATYDSNRVIT